MFWQRARKIPDVELSILNVIISFRISIQIPRHFSMTGEALVRRSGFPSVTTGGRNGRDSNVPFYNTLLVVNELIAANKDFDLILFPNRGHGFGREVYMMRRKWDYFVEHLLGAEPPKEYKFQ